MQILLSICLVLCLALTANCVRVRTHSKSQSSISQEGSWQYYVDEQLVGTKKVNAAAIIGLDGSVWAANGLSLNAGEGPALVALFKNSDNAFAGVTVGGQRYRIFNIDERSIYGKDGASGVVVVKTGQAIIISVYGESQKPGNAALVTEKLADYFIEHGY